jgi:hypothetical protein
LNGVDQFIRVHRFVQNAGAIGRVQLFRIVCTDNDDRNVACVRLGLEFVLHISTPQAGQFQVKHDCAWCARLNGLKGRQSIFDSDDGQPCAE